MRTAYSPLKLALAAVAISMSLQVARAEASLQRSAVRARCSKVVNDDSVRPYEASLRTGFLKAYKGLFPDARAEPDKTELSTAVFRCMGGHLLACFVGANLPCGKVDTSRSNRGASAFCRENQSADIVPMSATGHDTIYSYKCSYGRAKITEQNWKVDRRGFAVQVWKLMN